MARPAAWRRSGPRQHVPRPRALDLRPSVDPAVADLYEIPVPEDRLRPPRVDVRGTGASEEIEDRLARAARERGDLHHGDVDQPGGAGAAVLGDEEEPVLRGMPLVLPGAPLEMAGPRTRDVRRAREGIGRGGGRLSAGRRTARGERERHDGGELHRHLPFSRRIHEAE